MYSGWYYGVGVSWDPVDVILDRLKVYTLVVCDKSLCEPQRDSFALYRCKIRLLKTNAKKINSPVQPFSMLNIKLTANSI